MSSGRLRSRLAAIRRPRSGFPASGSRRYHAILRHARFFRRISRDLPTRGKARPADIGAAPTSHPPRGCRAVVGPRESDVTEPLIDLRALLVEREDFEGGMVVASSARGWPRAGRRSAT